MVFFFLEGANVLVSDSGEIKLADFGASKRVNGGTGGATVADMNATMKGTPYYMAPEVIMQTGHGRSSDLWSVGGTVLEMVTGTPPWKDMQFPTVMALMIHIAQSGQAPPVPDSLSQPLKHFLATCFQVLWKLLGFLCTPCIFYGPVPPSSTLCSFCCLQRDPLMRTSANELMQHPWLAQQQMEQSIGGRGTMTLLGTTSPPPLFAPLRA